MICGFELTFQIKGTNHQYVQLVSCSFPFPQEKAGFQFKDFYTLYMMKIQQQEREKKQAAPYSYAEHRTLKGC